MRRLLSLASLILLAGCVAPSQHAVNPDPAFQAKSMPATPDEEPRRMREEWSGELTLSTPILAVSSDPVSLRFQEDTVLTVTITTSGGVGGDVRLVLWDATGSMVLDEAGQSPLSVQAFVQAGQHEAYVTRGEDVGALRSYEALAEWTELASKQAL